MMSTGYRDARHTREDTMRKTTSRGLAEMTARGGQVEVTLAGVTLGHGNMGNIARNKIPNGRAA